MYVHLHVRMGSALYLLNIVFIADFDCGGLVGCPGLNRVASLITRKCLTRPSDTSASKLPPKNNRDADLRGRVLRRPYSLLNQANDWLGFLGDRGFFG
jgi:hypothetical protein